MNQKIRRTSNGKRLLTILFYALLFLCLLAAAFAFRTRGGRAVSPGITIESGGTVFFSQRDEAWASERLGDSAFTMGSSGCLVTCIASALNMQKTIPDNMEILTPLTLNAALSDAGAYDTQGNLLWDALHKSFALETDLIGSASSDLIDSYLEKGIYPIARVRVNGLGGYHFVLITGAEKGEYLCMDPLKKEAETVPLSEYAGRIYSLRCVYRPLPEDTAK